MKMIVLGLITLGSLVANASCPDLRGSYPVCKFVGGGLTLMQNVAMEQEIVNGVTQYSLSSDDLIDEERTTTLMIADEQIRSGTEEDLASEIKVSCADNKLLVSETLIDSEGTKLYGSKSFYTDGKKLIIQSTDDWREAGGGVVKSLEVCE